MIAFHEDLEIDTLVAPYEELGYDFEFGQVTLTRRPNPRPHTASALFGGETVRLRSGATPLEATRALVAALQDFDSEPGFVPIHSRGRLG